MVGIYKLNNSEIITCKTWGRNALNVKELRSSATVFTFQILVIDNQLQLNLKLKRTGSSILPRIPAFSSDLSTLHLLHSRHDYQLVLAFHVVFVLSCKWLLLSIILEDSYSQDYQPFFGLVRLLFTCLVLGIRQIVDRNRLTPTPFLLGRFLNSPTNTKSNLSTASFWLG